MVGTVPAPGMYRVSHQLWEIKHSKRGNWYAERHNGDGATQFLPSQSINAAWLHGPLGPCELADQPALCSTAGCQLPVWVRDICGMCLARQTVEKAREIKKDRTKSAV